MELFAAYIPRDRYDALAHRANLPDRTHGAALFADVSGFTQLTEGLSRALGPRRGVEELTIHLNRVYEAILKEVHAFGGSAIAFAGDAITCWFDGDDGQKATTSALAMQAAMSTLAEVPLPSGDRVTLAMKAGAASGPARRFAVGDPDIQLIDVMAGQTLVRMAAAANAARKGEVVLDSATAERMDNEIDVASWRAEENSGKRFAVVRALRSPALRAPWPAATSLEDAVIRPWLIQTVHDRLKTGHGEFLTELRPAIALFLKFEGIDYDADDAAEAKLNAFVRRVQSALARYEGFLIDVSIGDKGSYLYCTFGAPLAHENDPWRALAVALELRNSPGNMAFIQKVRIGISRGTMRTGAYGGTERRTYGVLGDDVNLAARLMEHATPGQVLVSGRVQSAAPDAFSWAALPAIRAKGKQDSIPVFALLGASVQPALRLLEPSYALPMVGRVAELALIGTRLDLAFSGHGQVVGITAEAGMGKSRLVAEVIRLANDRQLAGYGGQCQSYGTNTSYLAWWSIWQSFFNLAPEALTAIQIKSIEDQLAQIDPALVARLPLLGAVLNLPIADNEVTRAFDAKLRKASLEALLVDCLRHRAARTPLFLVLEDCHWIDPLSHDLLDVIARTIVGLPVLLVIAYRPADAIPSGQLSLRQLPHFTEVALAYFTQAEAERLIALKLAQLSGLDAAPPRVLVERLVARAEGNPFYVEELLNYLQDQRIDPLDTRSVEQLELPTSLYSLILSRIDRLTESQKTTLKVASVIGRMFHPATVWSVHTQLDEPQVKADLEVLKKIDLTPLDKPEPELTYIFKHIVTQEVSYESLSFATRARLHEAIGLFIERRHADALERQVDLLAFHFDRSPNVAKKREYLLKAGEAAQTRYANSAAINYYQRLLPMLAPKEQIPVMLKLGRVLELVGKWKEAGDLYARALTHGETLEDRQAQARCQTVTGELLRKQGTYADATSRLERARALFTELGDEAGVAETLHYAGTIAAQQGAYEKAADLYHQSLAIRRRLDDKPRVASLLSNLGILSWYQADFPAARSLYEEGLSIRRALGDRWSVANSLNNLGLVLRDQGDGAGARALLEESLAINRELGDRWSTANCLSSLGDVTLSQGDYAGARAFLEDSLAINQELGDRTGIAFILEYFAELAATQKQMERALRLAGAAEALRDSIGAPLSPAEGAGLKRALDASCAGLKESERLACTTDGRNMSLEQAVDQALGRSSPGSIS